MIIGDTFFKRDDVLHARLPGEVKKAFQVLARTKGKTVSEYVLELVLKELRREEGMREQSAVTTQNTGDHGK